ncbi:MAG TPA: hypothetical protein VJ917_07745 [Saprospiraceae bacterium]|nr:hypothetical protein [Saprospiraceae bacterium]
MKRIISISSALPKWGALCFILVFLSLYCQAQQKNWFIEPQIGIGFDQDNANEFTGWVDTRFKQYSSFKDRGIHLGISVKRRIFRKYRIGLEYNVQQFKSGYLDEIDNIPNGSVRTNWNMEKTVRFFRITLDRQFFDRLYLGASYYFVGTLQEFLLFDRLGHSFEIGEYGSGDVFGIGLSARIDFFQKEHIDLGLMVRHHITFEANHGEALQLGLIGSIKL